MVCASFWVNAGSGFRPLLLLAQSTPGHKEPPGLSVWFGPAGLPKWVLPTTAVAMGLIHWNLWTYVACLPWDVIARKQKPSTINRQPGSKCPPTPNIYPRQMRTWMKQETLTEQFWMPWILNKTSKQASPRRGQKNATEMKAFGNKKEMAHLTRVSWPGSCDDSILGVLICTKSCKWLQKCTWIPWHNVLAHTICHFQQSWLHAWNPV